METEEATKYTAGPWRICRFEPARVESCDPLLKIWQRICTCDHAHRTREGNNANAILIASAPELLTACESALEAIYNLMPKAVRETGCANSGVGMAVDDGPCPCTCCALRAAIAKAKGESQ